MARHNVFFGPIRIYLHREGAEFVAKIDPFSVCGVGRTEEAALRRARELLNSHLAHLVLALEEYGPRKVKILNPLPAKEKRGCIREYSGTVHGEVRLTSRKLPVTEVPLSRLPRFLGRHKLNRLEGAILGPRAL